MFNRYCTGMAGHEHWGEIPETFDILTQRLECPCGQSLHPTSSNPLSAGYREKDKITPVLKEI